MLNPKTIQKFIFFCAVSIGIIEGPNASQAATQDTPPRTSSDITPETRCVETDQIASYKVESDEIVRLFLKDNHQLILRLKRHCPQLHFHRYISYTPVDGKICAGSDEIKTRAGLACRIGSINPLPDAKEALPNNKSGDTVPRTHQ